MKDFFKFTFATIVGIIVASVVMMFVGLLAFFSITASTETETMVKDDSVFMLDMNGIIKERSIDNPLQNIINSEQITLGLNDILSSIEKAKENEKIKGIYLEANLMMAGPASIEAIRNELKSFKESGKFVVAYADTYSQGMYYLASVADKVLLNPSGMVEWKGLSVQPMFYKDLMEKVGIEMQIFRVGTYKSAIEPFVATEMSPANREQMEVYLQSTWKTMTSDVAESRNLTVEKLNELADQMMLFEPAEESVKAGLVDELIYKNDVRNYLKRLVKIDEDDTLNVLGLTEMTNVKNHTPKDPSGNIVAVYYAEGEIVDTELAVTNMEPYINSTQVIKDLRNLKDDDAVKAVVLRVNSPGGSAYGSEQIWKAITELKAEKPVIVSMGDYAASGGYYISCNADSIVAEPTTLTGSIGIFGMFPNAQKLTDKIGLDFDVVKTNKYADFGMLTRPMNTGEKALLQAHVERGYDLFLTRCANGRDKSKEDINKIGQGRVWTGVMAKDLGLVDVLGGLDKALEIAVAKAGIEKYTVLNYPKPDSFLDLIMATRVDNYVKASVMNSKMGQWYKPLFMIENFDQLNRVQARLPFEMNLQ